jgi:Zn-dependent protease with chaperone function
VISRRGPSLVVELLLLLPFAALGMAALLPAGYVLSRLTELPWWLPSLFLPLCSPLALTRPVELLLARVTKGHRRPQPEELLVIESAIRRVEAQCSKVPKKWVIVVEASPTLNAFTSGRHTIGVTTVALKLPRMHFDAVIAHELAHQYNNDTWATALRAWLLEPLRWVVRISQLGGWLFAGLSVLTGAAILPALVLALIVWLGSLPVIVLAPLMGWVQRRNELAADAFAVDLGYAAELTALLLVADQPEPVTLWGRMITTHPDKELRLQALRQG